ncbi:unnamed protein product, partial [Staurois parvus]
LPKGQQSLVIPCTVCSLWSFPALSAVSGHPLHCLQSLVIPCTVCSLWSFPELSAVSGHLLHCVRSLCGHLLHCVRSLWSSPVLSLQSLVISCTKSAVSDHPLYCVCSPLECLTGSYRSGR